MEADRDLPDDQLPPGQAPVWIEPPSRVTKIKMLERVIKITELEQYNDNVTVIKSTIGKDNEVILDMCKKKGYKNIENDKMTGAEDQVVILLNTLLGPEQITRGINMLIIATR